MANHSNDYSLTLEKAYVLCTQQEVLLIRTPVKIFSSHSNLSEIIFSCKTVKSASPVSFRMSTPKCGSGWCVADEGRPMLIQHVVRSAN